MNNTWETNFKMDLSGFSEFRYGVEIVEQGTAEKDMESLSDNDKGVVTFICGQSLFRGFTAVSGNEAMAVWR